MPPIHEPRRLDRLLVESLGRAGYRVERPTGSNPRGLFVARARLARLPQRLHVHLLPLLPVHGRGARRAALALDRRAFARIVAEPAVETVPLLLGFDAQRGVLVGWPRAATGARSLGGRPWVPLDALERASEGEVVELSRRRGRHAPAPAVAFQPERLDAYLRRFVAPDPDEPADTPRAVASEPVTVSAARPPEVDFGRGLTRSILVAPPLRLDRRRRVETGFAPDGDPAANLPADEPLAPGGAYSFWFAVGGARGASIERDPAASELPALERATLVVRVHAFDGEVELLGPTRGTIELAPGRAPCVGERAASVSGGADLHERTLFFPVRMPAQEGRFHLRCNVYLGSTVVQSRLVSCQVGGPVVPDRPALASDLDYALTDSLALARLAQVPEHELSLLVNGVGSSHQFRFFSASGDEELAADATLDASAVGRLIDTARAALSEVSWGSPGPWDRDPESYRYRDGGPATFEQDLMLLARRGRDLFAAIVGRFDDPRDEERLEQLGARGISVQIATTSSSLYVPAALFYDHRLETSPGRDAAADYRLCDAFAGLLASEGEAADLVCLRDGCAQRDDLFRVCPSGFWGFRHALGWPMRVDDSQTRAVGDRPPRIVVGVSTDPQFVRRDAHVKHVLELVGADEDDDDVLARSRDQLTPLLKRDDASLVYLYCHGGVNRAKVPFVELGEPGRDNGINTTFLDNERIRWSATRPLVFINGCHTTALEPSQVLDLVDGFVRRGRALGVVGTELTVFEPLACAFAEAALPGYLDRTQTIGEAVRQARLALLSERNPLGLVYVPFVASGTRLGP